MTPAQVRRRYKTIEKHQWKWADAERKLQLICTHLNVEKKYDSNTGNYDPSADSYWIDFFCPDCRKRWRVDQ